MRCVAIMGRLEGAIKVLRWRWIAGTGIDRTIPRRGVCRRSWWGMGCERFGFGRIGFAILMFGRSGLTDGIPGFFFSLRQRDDFGGSVGLWRRRPILAQRRRRSLRYFTHSRFGDFL